MTDLVVHGASEVVLGPPRDGTEAADGSPETAVAGDDIGLATVTDGAVAVDDGAVVAIGSTERVVREHPPETAATAIDAAGKTVLPGFVDPHSHAVFAGDRADEYAAKLRGASYRELLDDGGGIHRTVRATQEANTEALTAALCEHLDAMLATGTTTAEVKSGYGLTATDERRLLDAIAAADECHPVDVVPTFMGAHAVPEGVDPDDYVDRVVSEQLPAVADAAAFCDVFCEAGVFSVDQSRRVLEAGREHGLTPKVHAEEFERIGGAGLAAELGAASADHLLAATDDDARALADAGVTPVLLPGTAFALGTAYADPDPFVAAGAPPAIATDFNPNCFSRSMEFAVDLACGGMRLPPAAAIRAATDRAAAALERTDGTGTLRPGAPGDLLVADAVDHAHVPYAFGERTVETVVKAGSVVASDGTVVTPAGARSGETGGGPA